MRITLYAISGLCLGLATLQLIMSGMPSAWGQEDRIARAAPAATTAAPSAPAPGSKVESDPFPLDVCVVMQGPLAGKPHIVEVGDREIRVCCLDCITDLRRDPEKWTQAVDERIKEEQRPLYPLDTCIVDAAKFAADASPVDLVFRNRLFRLCGEECEKKLRAEPARYFALLNKAVIEKQKPAYPLKTCAVSGKPLGDGAIDHVVGNQLIRLADPGQLAKFNDNPGEFLARVREARKSK